SGQAGDEVTITGANLSEVFRVRFNGVAARTIIVVNNNQIRAIVPSKATTGKIALDAPGGTSTSALTFEITSPLPSITSFTPGSGQAGDEVTITGANLSEVFRVRFNGAIATFTQVSDTQIRAVVPATATTGKVTVEAPAGMVTSALTFEITSPLPSITSFTPGSGQAGDEVTITGANLSEVSRVRFNGAIATFTQVSDTQIRAVVPATATTGKVKLEAPAGIVTSFLTFEIIEEVSEPVVNLPAIE
ncbi:IPT/TIG domain-containing protein, partial [Pontibacter sp. H249]|uniref:IPT/TIG domain-containing protein n=1 Tax=Pontibacter sp. H249 TaxID=3133420 RepID=UPI0030BDC639